ncbi:hypothetical protein BSLG_003826 [Batrachochytrium salamandrivorans]|nr:hypothetical protein BSLG_003826 [Batrachochytrium salamandrivorans]
MFISPPPLSQTKVQADAILSESKEWLTDDKYLVPVIADDLYSMCDAVDIARTDKGASSNDELVQALLAELRDTVRTEAYRNFIYNNKDYFKDKVVLDVGCGTGILSMFAAKAGARLVIAVDNSTIIQKAKLIATKNSVDHIITQVDVLICVTLSFISSYRKLYAHLSDFFFIYLLYYRFIAGKIEEIKMPVDKVDVIISEWMMAGIEDSEWVNEKLNFWNDVYGFNMDLMKKGFLSDGQVDFADPLSIVTDVCTVIEIDATGVAKPSDLDFESDYTIHASKNGTLHAICGWFDIEFRGNAGSGGMRTLLHWANDKRNSLEADHVCVGRAATIRSW